MWPPLLNLLESIAKLRFPIAYSPIHLNVGEPSALDALGGQKWLDYKKAEPLYRAWGPVADSPWLPFHCVTLFAAIERLGATVGPTRPEDDTWPPAVDLEALSKAPSWLEPGTLTVIDLPGPRAVALGARFVIMGAQPVCTFDNWPHRSAVLRPELVIAQLLRYASLVASHRQALAPDAPPVWLCDSDRLSGCRPMAGEFDNRYFLDDSIMPGPDYLKSAGIGKVVVIYPPGTQFLQQDLEATLLDIDKAGIGIWTLSADNLWAEPSSFTPAIRNAPQVGKRNAAGGFGHLVPLPSSSSSG